MQKVGPREWAAHKIPDTDGSLTVISVGPDKNKRQIRTEMCSKVLLSVLSNHVKNEKFYLQRIE
eukprot:11999800-Karenia_brevis.AAC.1